MGGGSGIEGVSGHLDGEQDGADLQGGAPLILEDIQADPAQLVDVRVVDAGDEADLDRRCWAARLTLGADIG